MPLVPDAAETRTADAMLDEVTVRETAPARLVDPPDDRPNTETHVGREGIRVLGGPAQVNPWRALQTAPSVNMQSADPYGLGNRMSFRVRGKSGTHVGRTVNGLPIAGEPAFANGKGGADLFDLENMSDITLMRGAVPAGSGLGFSNSSVVDMTLRGPEQAFGITASQAFGSNNFRRTFVRLDSGQLSAAPVRFFVSASDTSADKWRGPGESERWNGEFGLHIDVGERLAIELFGVHHKVEWNEYRALSYAQVQDPSTYRSFEYNAQLTGNPAQDILYHGFNRQNYTNDAYLGRVTLLTGESSRLVFKPYYWKEEGYSLSGANTLGAPGITWWEIVHDTYGFDLRHESKHAWGELAVGYWYQSSEAPPPPTAQRLYRINADGSLRFERWTTLAKTTRHAYHNPYVSVTTRLGKAEATAGLRYMNYRDPSFTYYLGNTAPDVSYKSVFDSNPQVDPDMYSNSRKLQEWLPNLGVTYPVSDSTLLRASYGRTYGRQNWGSVASAFTTNRAAFAAAGLRFDDIWSRLRPELSENFDVGARFVMGNAYIAPTLYHIRYTNKQLSLFDPAVGVAYHQSVAKAQATGIELEVGAAPTRNLDVYFSLSLNRAEYSEDARTGSGTIVNTKGKQMQDSPRQMASIGAVWRLGSWSIAPLVRYTGRRFGGTVEDQAVAGYAVADLGIDYALGNVAGLQNLGIGLSVTNIFDKRYIGIINTNDYAVGGLPSYLPGAPRTVAVTLSGRF
ncbi:MAG: TonB-dependent receptor [Burkholderiales bacterium]|nr:TonB-dependent receptor [Burkholderiales bacterium]OJX07733.1 MAG: hypothetical protein BGO72_18445 [Burkholderiales bacterium 70-64]